jgi:hypothetical protein
MAAEMKCIGKNWKIDLGRFRTNTETEKQNWRILTDKESYGTVKKPTITETVSLHRLCWFGHEQRVEGNRISKRVLYMNLESTRPIGR